VRTSKPTLVTTGLRVRAPTGDGPDAKTPPRPVHVNAPPTPDCPVSGGCYTTKELHGHGVLAEWVSAVLDVASANASSLQYRFPQVLRV
jgi:hypothetical protein